MANAYLKTTNSKYILSQNTRKEKRTVVLQMKGKKVYHAMCAWFSIDHCIQSQIWFFGTISLSINMLIMTYVIGGV